MRFFTAILLPCAMILAFGLLPTSSLYGCSGKKQAGKKEVKHADKYQKDCCKKPCSDPKKKKKGCCGGNDCSCAPNLVVIADLPNALPIVLSKRPILFHENSFFFISTILKSTIQDIWQPPISVLSVL